ncbi:type II CAAX prenyl endopeptidase Rce1 family protein [Niveibacterium terrae]|uniref:CPBP family glutamic-type intramembrane protease n=1 Tax=Niveibacterium terrae TaxID=3373598 RepID=UPI003A947E99
MYTLKCNKCNPFSRRTGSGFVGYVFRVGTEYIVVSLLVYCVTRLFDSGEGLRREPSLGFGFLAIVAAPVYETVFFQVVPAKIAKSNGAGAIPCFLATSIPFAVFHFGSNYSAAISGGVVGGIYLSMAFWDWSYRGIWAAFSAAVMIHSIHNAVVFFLVLFFQ